MFFVPSLCHFESGSRKFGEYEKEKKKEKKKKRMDEDNELEGCQ